MDLDLLVSFIAIAISVFAFTLSLIQFFLESNRNKKKSTLTAYRMLQDDVFSRLNILFLQYEDEKLYKFAPGDEVWEEITVCLSKIEEFSVGLNSGIYSIEILNRLGGGYFIRVFDRLKPIIDKKRYDNISKEKHYDEFEATVSKLQSIRRS